MTTYTSDEKSTIFFHLPKTGGMTFRAVLQQMYPDSFHVCKRPDIQDIKYQLGSNRCIEFHPVEYDGRFVSMHTALLEEPHRDILMNANLFVMFRDPLSQFISQYYDGRRKMDLLASSLEKAGISLPPTLDAYLELPGVFNNQLSFMVNGTALDNRKTPQEDELNTIKGLLKDCRFNIGITERYEESLHILERVTGRQISGGCVELKNQNPDRPSIRDIDDTLISRIREGCRLDYELYESALVLFEERLKSLGPGRRYYFFRSVPITRTAQDGFSAKGDHTDDWSLHIEPGHAANLSIPDARRDEVRVDIKTFDKTNAWAIQLNKTGFVIEKDHQYIVRCRARADHPRRIHIGFAQAEPPWNGLGLYAALELRETWQTFETVFAATSHAGSGRIHFDLGASDVAVDIATVTLQERHIDDADSMKSSPRRRSMRWPRWKIIQPGLWSGEFSRLSDAIRHAPLNRYLYPLLAMVRRDFKSRYAPTVLGLGWAILQPTIFLLLYTFVFTVILKVQFHPEANIGHSALYIICGFLPYLALSEGIQRASTSLIESRSLLQKVIFPAEVLPAAGVISATVTEVSGLVLLIGLAFGFDIYPSWQLIFLPILILTRVAITLGISWLVSILNVFISDLGQILGLVLMAWLFLTPIFYPVDNIPDGLTWLLPLNPLYYLTMAYRAVLLEQTSPLSELLVLIGWAIGISIVGLYFFRRMVDRAKDFV